MELEPISMSTHEDEEKTEINKLEDNRAISYLLKDILSLYRKYPKLQKDIKFKVTHNKLSNGLLSDLTVSVGKEILKCENLFRIQFYLQQSLFSKHVNVVGKFTHTDQKSIKNPFSQYEIEVLLRRFFDEYLVPTLSKKNITDPSWHRNHNPTMSEPHLFLEKTMSNELSIFYKSTKKNSLIFTDSINHKEIKMLFDFIYQNQVKITKIRHKLKP